MYVVPEVDNGGDVIVQHPCVVIELVGGPKRYARFWPQAVEPLEWGWILPDTAVRVAAGTMPAD